MEEESIKVRFLPETHEVLLHPFFYTILIKECTSPRDGMARPPLVEKAYRKIYPVARELGVGFTKRATEILINSSVKLGLLHKNLHWTARGHVINALGHSSRSIGKHDRIAYLKYYLDSDGAAIIHLIRKMVEREQNGLVDRSNFLSNRGWEETVIALVREHLAESLEPSQKIELKGFMRRAEKGYAPHTREHRFNPRAETLVDLRILKRISNKRISYGFIERDKIRLDELFLELFSNAKSLEIVLSENGDFFHRAGELYDLGNSDVNLTQNYDLLEEATIEAYEDVRDDTFRLASIMAISDIVCIKLLIDKGIICESKDLRKILEMMRNKEKGKVRFHVDDWGKITFITVDPLYVNRIVS